MTKELNIKSSTIEKGLELVKDFATKLIGPTVEEVGLLMSDKIKYFRFKNQVKILAKAQQYVKDKNIKIKEIPTKILVPLLENASLEEDEEIQEKWSFMIGNLADSSQNLQNQIFPYLLTQISLNEFEKLLEFNDKEKNHLANHNKLLNWQKENDYSIHSNAEKTYLKLSEKVNQVQQNGFWVKGLEEYEYANLQRLGLLRQLPPKIIIGEFKTTEYVDYDYGYNSRDEEWHKVDAEYDPDDYGYRITSLGIRFLTVCEEKKANG